MSFFSDILASVKKKSAEIKERQEFLNLVEQEAKPIRRAAYMKQMLSEVVNEGKEKAKADAAAKIQKKKTPQDFGIGINAKSEFGDDYLNLNKFGKKQ